MKTNILYIMYVLYTSHNVLTHIISGLLIERIVKFQYDPIVLFTIHNIINTTTNEGNY